MKRKLFNSFVFLTLLTAISAIFVFNSSAAGYAKQGDFTYYIDGARAVVAKYDGNAENVTVPSKVGSATVVGIGNQAFWSKKSIKTLSLPSTILAIGKAAFNECTGITKLVLPSNLRTIADSAFWYCTGLKAMYIPPSVTGIAATAFKGCKNLTAYVIPGTYAEKFVKADPNVKLGYLYASSIKFSVSSGKAAMGTAPQLKYTISPANVYNSKVTFKSSDTSVATVSAKGVVTPKKIGKTVITVTTTDGSNKSSSMTLYVVPQKVTGLKQTSNSTTGYSFSWNAAKGAMGYGIYQYNATKKIWDLKKVQTNCSYTVTGLKPGNYGDYKILAYAKIGSTYYKATASDTLRASVLTPGNVNNVKSTATGNTVTLTWNAAPNTTGYELYKYNELSKSYELYGKTPKLTATVKNLEPNKKYVFAIRAYLVYGGKTYFAPTSVKNITAYTLPEKVTKLRVNADSLTQTSAMLTWKMVKGVSGYELYSIDSASKQTLVAKLTGSAITGYTVDGLKPGQAVKYAVRAFSTSGTLRYGPMSDTVTVQTTTAPSTSEEAFEGFVDALNSSKSSTDDFYLIKATEVSGLAGMGAADCADILDTIAKPELSKLYFEGGIEGETALTAESFIYPLNAPSTLKYSDVKSFEYSENGDGYTVTVELKEENTATGANAKIAPVINWGVVAGQHKGFIFDHCLYEGTVIEAKVQNGRIEYMTITMPLQFAFTVDMAPYLFSETITHHYIFGW